MHPLWKDKRALALYLASWVGLGSLLAAASAARGGLAWEEAYGVVLLPTFMLGFVCLSTWYLCLALPVDRTPVIRIFVAFLSAAAVTGVLWVLILWGWSSALEVAGVWPGIAGRVRSQAIEWFVTGNLLFLLATAVHYLLIAAQKAGENERVSLQLRLLARDAELRALRAQIDPHFLFNSLNSISSLTGSDPASARAMVLRLAGFLRSALDNGRRELVTLKEELALARDYLEIERVRFGDRLTVAVTAEEEALRCAVPPLILQPLVENAVKHGIAHAVGGGTISLELTRSGGRLVCRVRNPVENDRPRGAGVGLANVRQRVERLYGRESMMTVAEEPGQFLVELSLPAREMPG